MTARKNSVGLSCGMMMCQNRCQAFAPSSAAASSSSRGRSCMRARRMSIPYPKRDQIDTSARAGRTRVVLPSHESVDRPISPMSCDHGPPVEKTQVNTVAASTRLVTTGRKNTER
ncbi:hypothetical protein D3C74_350320 [compost metagenome]